MRLNTAKAQALDGLVRSLPDSTLSTLRAALSSEHPGPWSEPVRLVAEAEAADRRLRDAVLRELVAMSAQARSPRPPRNPVSPWAPAALWRGLREIAPQQVQRCAEFLAEREHDRFERAALKLLETATEALDGGAGPFALVAEKLDGGLGGVQRVARIVQLSPLVRQCVPRARAWLKGGAKDEASAVRLAVSDASALCLEGGPLLIDILAAQFEEPWAAIRLVSAVMDRPKETFMAASELGCFAEDVFVGVEEAVQSLRTYNGDYGREAGAAAAAAAQTATEGAAELEHAIQLDKDQAWGRRIAVLKRSILQAAEARLKEADGLVAAALPLLPTRPGVKILRGTPDLQTRVPPLAVSRAEALLVFIDGTRRAAVTGGFAGLRGKVLEVLDARIGAYADDLLDLLRTPDPETVAEARARLPVAADFLALVREPAAGQMLRRRLAAAA